MKYMWSQENTYLLRRPHDACSLYKLVLDILYLGQYSACILPHASRQTEQSTRFLTTPQVLNDAYAQTGLKFTLSATTRTTNISW